MKKLLWPLLGLGGLASTATSQQAEFQTLTNTVRSVANFNVETIRGMAWDAAQGRLYAINTHGSTLVYFATSLPAGSLTPPTKVFSTLNYPSALGLWDDASGRRFAIVVGGGSHGVAKQDRDSGEIVDYLTLPSEPMDVVIDNERGLAFVSCAGAYDRRNDPSLTPQPPPRGGGVVVQIDLAAFAKSGGPAWAVGEHFIDALRPTFLNLETGVDGNPSDNFVYVAPLLSGNNSTFVSPNNGDFLAGTVSGLPDDDLFRIDNAGNVTSVLHGAGTLLTAHARNPATGQYWVCNVESLNAGKRTESEHQGRFAANRITLANPSGAGFSVSGAPVDLDSLPGAGVCVPASARKPASFPFGLSVHSSGIAAVVSSTGDVVRILDGTVAGAANTISSIGLPEGSIPRGALLDPSVSVLWVYAWGTNRILQFQVADLLFPNPNSTNPVLYDLGVDPLPAAVKHGRRIWYDADNSRDPVTNVAGKVTCNTCHPRGGMDLLGWGLSGDPQDRKDLMVTQSLLSIEDTFPYHWRGERFLSDFNEAFDKLLGGSELGPDDLADFEAFVFSLQAPANPREDINRVLYDFPPLDPTSDGFEQLGSGRAGQEVFFEEPDVLRPFEPATCAACHGPESGSNGVITPDLVSALPSSVFADSTHLRQLQHKIFQPSFLAQSGTAQVLRPRNGFALSQDGDDLDILSFFQPAVFFTHVSADEAVRMRGDVSAFVVQFDQGIAPRAHAAALFANSSSAQDLADAAALVGDALKGYCDVAVIGHFMNSGVPVVPFHLWFDPPTGRFFTAEKPTSFSLDFPTLDALRNAGVLQLTMIGLPLGGAFRFAVDPDDDGLSSTAEANYTGPTGLHPDPMRADSDGDGFPDGYESVLAAMAPGGPDPTVADTLAVIQAADDEAPDFAETPVLDHVTARLSKHFVKFTEPVTYEVHVQKLDPATGSFLDVGVPQRHSALRSVDTLIAHGLIPGILDDTHTLGSVLAARTEEFRLKVALYDLAGNSSTVLIGGKSDGDLIETRPQVLGDVAVVAGGTPELVTSSLSATRMGTNRVHVEVDVDDFCKGATPAGSIPSHEANQWILLQFLVESTTQPGVFELLPAAQLTAVAGVRLETQLSIPGSVGGGPISWGGPGDVVQGPFLVTDPTDTAGKVGFDVDVSGITAPRTCRVVMFGAAKPLTATSTNVLLGFSERYWSLPSTLKENRSVQFDF